MTAPIGSGRCRAAWRRLAPSSWLRTTLSACALIVAGPAQADLPLWELGLGAGWVHLPHYRGSDQSHDWLLPVPYAVYRGDILRADRDGARAVLVDLRSLDIDVSVAASPPTKSSDNRARSGMRDLAATVEVGPNVNWTLWRAADSKLDLRLPVRGVTALQSPPRGIGWTLNPVLNLDITGSDWNIGVQAGPQFQSRRYNAHFYGVAEADARPDRPAYDASGGFAGWHALLAGSRRVGDWWVGAFVRADSLAGASFDNSPLVRQRHSWSAGLAFSWIFAVSDERVANRR